MSNQSQISPPDVSIVVIAYNEAKRITDCLNALSAQITSLNYEVIVVDDGSTDRTSDLVRAAYKRDPRIRLIRSFRNLGRGAARDTGVKSANADVIGFIDADIVTGTDWLDRLYIELDGRTAVSGAALPDGDCAVIWRLFHPTPRTKPGSVEITGNNLLIRASALREVGFDRRHKLGEDFRLACTLASRGHSLATITDVTVEHREAKSYRKAVQWLYHSGVDANRLLLEFRRVRTPDLAAFGWLALVALTPLIGLLSTPAAALALLTTYASAAAFGHAWSRFTPRKRPLRWLAAAISNIPLMTAYLIGRTFGLLVLINERGTAVRDDVRDDVRETNSQGR